ncbi:MAG TPA: hypothetical protein V6D48_14285, partial [Oculatellaceae cyanobacterium]
LKTAAMRVEAATNHHHLRKGKIYLFSSISYSASRKKILYIFSIILPPDFINDVSLWIFARPRYGFPCVGCMADK